MNAITATDDHTAITGENDDMNSEDDDQIALTATSSKAQDDILQQFQELSQNESRTRQLLQMQ